MTTSGPISQCGGTCAFDPCTATPSYHAILTNRTGLKVTLDSHSVYPHVPLAAGIVCLCQMYALQVCNCADSQGILTSYFPKRPLPQRSPTCAKCPVRRMYFWNNFKASKRDYVTPYHRTVSLLPNAPSCWNHASLSPRQKHPCGTSRQQKRKGLTSAQAWKCAAQSASFFSGNSSLWYHVPLSGTRTCRPMARAGGERSCCS